MSTSIFDRQAVFSKARNEGGLDQRAVIDRLKRAGPTRVVSNRRDIPMGDLIPELLQTERELEDAVYTWLRSTKDWESLTICFAKDPDLFKFETKVLQRFSDPKNPTLPWRRNQGPTGNSEGLWNMREVIAKAIMNNNNVVKIEITRDSIKLFTDAAGKFGPYRKATAKDVAAFNDEIKEILEAKRTEAEASGTAYVAPEIPELQVGDTVKNEDFKPFIEWVKIRHGEGIQ